jgi:hypothetical protein
MSLKSKIQHYIKLEDKHVELLLQLKNIKNIKSHYETQIIDLIKSNNLAHSTLSFESKKISIQETKTTPPISKKLLKEVFQELNINEDTIEIIFDSINKKKIENTKENDTLKIKR